ncbi:MAG: ABC transporter substrate-binding protein, partial [Actinobacteria bacterium]|nr:ABC transporter substrate-binding protein [Actinomycetota bacterium]
CLLVGAGLVLAACGNGGTSSTGPPPHNNVLYYGTPGEPDSLDPGGGISGFDGYYLTFIYDTLVHTNPKTGNAEPGLATSWQFTGADKLTFQLTLRQGVKFQDGTPLDAQAVKSSLDHYRAGGIWGDLFPVAGETVVDDHTLDINLKSPYSPLPLVLAGRAGMIMSPTALQKEGKDFGRNPVGAGPYTFKSWQPGAEIDLSRFAGFWNPNAKPHFNGVTFKVIPDATAMSNAVQTGQIDFAPLITGNAGQIQAARKSSRVNTQLVDVNGMAIITTNNKVAPFNNVLVRRAVNMSVNRQALADAVEGPGVGKGPAWQFEAPDYWTYSKDLKDYKFDPAQAKQLLAQAGYPNGITVQICNFADPTAVQIEKQTMGQAGINLDIKQEPVNACVAGLQNATFPMVQIGWIGQASPYYTFQTMFGSTGTGSFGPYQNVDNLLNQIASTYTQQAQKPLFDQMNKTLFDQAPSVPLYYLVNVFSYNKRLHGLVADKSGAVRFDNASF